MKMSARVLKDNQGHRYIDIWRSRDRSGKKSRIKVSKYVSDKEVYGWVIDKLKSRQVGKGKAKATKDAQKEEIETLKTYMGPRDYPDAKYPHPPRRMGRDVLGVRDNLLLASLMRPYGRQAMKDKLYKWVKNKISDRDEEDPEDINFNVVRREILGPNSGMRAITGEDCIRYCLRLGNKAPGWFIEDANYVAPLMGIEGIQAERKDVNKPKIKFGQEGGSKRKSNSDGLSGDEIDDIMARYVDRGFIAAIPRDMISKINPGDFQRLSFVLNLDPHNKPGTHWVSVYIDCRDDKDSSNSVEYFDSFADPCPKDIRYELKGLVDKMRPSNLLKFKENRVVRQSEASDNCGYFACEFLIDRYRGKSFADATGYSDKIIHAAKKGEREIKKLKKEGRFGYL